MAAMVSHSSIELNERSSDRREEGKAFLHVSLGFMVHSYIIGVEAIAFPERTRCVSLGRKGKR